MQGFEPNPSSRFGAISDKAGDSIATNPAVSANSNTSTDLAQSQVSITPDAIAPKEQDGGDKQESHPSPASQANKEQPEAVSNILAVQDADSPEQQDSQKSKTDDLANSEIKAIAPSYSGPSPDDATHSSNADNLRETKNKPAKTTPIERFNESLRGTYAIAANEQGAPPQATAPHASNEGQQPLQDATEDALTNKKPQHQNEQKLQTQAKDAPRSGIEKDASKDITAQNSTTTQSQSPAAIETALSDLLRPIVHSWLEDNMPTLVKAALENKKS